VLDSPSSSDSRARGRQRRPIVWLCCALLSGCATVRAEDKEYLADPAMNFRASEMAQRHEQHVLDNREGSAGGGNARGGGCGCN
jgi:hypothetical protein